MIVEFELLSVKVLDRFLFPRPSIEAVVFVTEIISAVVLVQRTCVVLSEPFLGFRQIRLRGALSPDTVTPDKSQFQNFSATRMGSASSSPRRSTTRAERIPQLFGDQILNPDINQQQMQALFIQGSNPDVAFMAPQKV